MNTLLKIKTWYKVHKWISIVTGLVIAMWLVTGIVLTSPDPFPQVLPHYAGSPAMPDFRTVEMSPAEAVGRLAGILGQTPSVSAVKLTQVWDLALVYHITLTDGQIYLIDAATGNQFEMTPDMAAAIAKADYATGSLVARVERLEQHDLGYMDGPLPAYRVVFDERKATYTHIAVYSGELQRTNIMHRAILIISGLHTLETFIVFFHNKDMLINLLVWLATIFSLIAAVVGYYLALPRRWHVSPRKQSEASS